MNLLKQKIELLSKDFTPRKEAVLAEYKSPEKEVTSSSGIVVELNRSSLERQTSGKVVAVGSDLEWFKEGDLIVWANTDGINLEFIDGDFILLKEHSILGKKS